MPVSDSARTCWIAAAVAGLLVWFATSGPGGMRWFEGAFLGLSAGAILGPLLVWLRCGGPPAQDSSAWQASLPVKPEPAALAEIAPETAGKVPAAADDLTKIKGIGPKLEDMLHRQGVTRFEQIAAWDRAEIERLAGLIGRTQGRIRNEDWAGQARALIAARKGGAG